MTSSDVVVVGGGIAGLSVLAGLTADGGLRACLLEREAVLGAHASGRNAAIHRPLEDDQTTARLVARSRKLMQAEARDGFLTPTGLFLATAGADGLERLDAHATRQGVGVERLDSKGLLEAAPHLTDGEVTHALAVEGGGVLDIHAMLAALRRRARAAGHTLRMGAGVRRVIVERGRVAGVELSCGERIAARHVVIAAGAWGRELGEACACPLPLQPARRHLVQLRCAAGVQPPLAGGPVIWRLDTEIYVRPEGKGLLASPCDSTPWVPPQPQRTTAREDSMSSQPPSDPAVLEQLAERLGALCPRYRAAAVQSYWACLRTFAPDRELIAGPDPRLPGLHWLAGLGGRGMSVGPAAGALVARGVEGDFDCNFDDLNPMRWI